MKENHDQVYHHIRLIESAMKKAGVWTRETPMWVYTYQEGNVQDIWQWLQYVYLPMRVNGTWYKPHYVAPVLSPFMNTNPDLHHILQLVIELDSLSTTLEKK